MNVIDESYRVGMMLAKTPEGTLFFQKKETADRCLEEVFGDIAASFLDHKNSFFEYRILDENLKYQLELPQEQRAPFIKEQQIKKLLENEDWQDAVAYTGDFAVHIEKMLDQIQMRGSFKDVKGFTMTSKLRNAGLGLETAYQRTGLYDFNLFQKIAYDRAYGEQLQEYEKQRQNIGGNLSHYAYSQEARRLMRRMAEQGYDPQLMYMSENLYMLKDLMEEAIFESFFGGRVTIQPDVIRKVRIKELENGFCVIALWTEWTPELLEARDRFIYDVILDGERYNCAMKDIRFQWNWDSDCYVRMMGLLYPKNDVGAFRLNEKVI